jgi:hypothetical protein
MAAQLVASRAVLSSTELVSEFSIQVKNFPAIMRRKLPTLIYMTQKNTGCVKNILYDLTNSEEWCLLGCYAV